MAEQDLKDLQRHSAIQDARISNLETKFEMFMQEMQDFKTEMRDRDKQRAKEIAEIRGDIKEINKTTDAKIAGIQTAIDGINKHVQNISIAAFVGIGAMVITFVIGIAAMVWSVINR